MKARFRRLLATVLAATALIAAACSSDGTSEGTPDTAGDTSLADAEIRIQGMPGSPVGLAFSTVLADLLSGTATEASVESTMTDTFLELASASEVLAGGASLPGLLSGSPVVAGLSVDSQYAVVGTLLNSTDGSRWSFGAAVEPSEPHRFHQWAIGPEQPVQPAQATTLDEAVAAWNDLAPISSLLIVELSGSDEAVSCSQPLVAAGAGGETAEEPVGAIGSAFKFYVLGAVASAVEAGTISWEDRLPIVENLKSLPSGQLQVEPEGTEIAVADAAELMMAISDNTATDHLINLVGREAVEAAVGDLGHSDPALVQPLMTTREFFLLKLGDPIRLGLYEAGSPSARRALLDELADEPLPDIDAAVARFVEPAALGVEWLASTADLCRAITGLEAQASIEPVIARALQAGHGVEFDRGLWPSVGFKGGSEPGVLTLTWLAERDDGSRFVVSGLLNNPDDVIDDAAALAVAQVVFELLGER